MNRANGGDAIAICVGGERCATLLSTECPQLDGPYEEDDTFVVGVMDTGSGWNATVLAEREINRFGLSGGAGSGSRKLLLLRCSISRPIEVPS